MKNYLGPLAIPCLSVSLLLAGCAGSNNAPATTATTTTPQATAPTVSSITPTAVTAGAAATTLTVNGTGFTTATTVQVNGTAETTTYVGATQVTAVVPAGQLATGVILQVSALNGTAASASVNLEVDNPAPTIAKFSPAFVIAGSGPATVSVSGTGFLPSTTIQVGAASRVTTYVSATQVNVAFTAADFASAAVLGLTAVNPAPGGGTSFSASLPINNPAPAITQLTPSTLAAGSAATVISVTGTGFVPTTTVSVAGAIRATTYTSPTQVSVTLTAADLAAAGSLSLTATSPAPGGGTSAAASIAINIGTPTITSFTPTSLITASSTPTTVTVNGTNFNSGTYVSLLGSVRATTVLSSTQLTFVATVADQISPATLRVSVVNPVAGGTSLGATASLLVAGPTATPVISSAQPTTFFVGSSSTAITIYGTGITSNSTVQWNGTTLPGINGFYYSGSTIAAITIPVPASLLTALGTATVTVTIANPPAPTLTAVSPGYGVLNTAATLTLTGTGFTANSTVTFNGANVPATYASATSLTIAVPASAITLPGNLPIAVTTPAPGGGTSASLPFTAYVGIVNNSMIYNPVNGLAYVSVPSSAGVPYGNSIVSVDPATGALGTPIYVGSEPNKLALTSDGKFLWVGLDGASAVRKVDLTANTAGLQFTLNGSTTTTSYTTATALALAALPGATDSVVVSSSASNYYNIAIAIYDSGVPRANSSSTSTYYNSTYALTVDGTRGEIYAGAGSTLYVFTYSSNGLTLKTSGASGNYASYSPSDEFQIANGLLYTDYGKAYDPETGALKGTFYLTGSTVATGSATVDPTLGRVFTIDSSTGSYYAPNQIQIFNAADYTQNAVLPVNIPNYINSTTLYPSRLTRWATNGLVFRESIGVFSLRSNLVKDLSTTLANLNVTLANSGSLATGGSTTYTATVTNAGPSAASNVTLTAMPPSTGIVVSATPSVGTCSVATTIACDLGSLALNASATVTFVVTQTTSGSAVFTAQVSASETDSNLTDNQASLTLAVTGSAYSPQPLIRSVSPASVVAGTGDTLITVTGSNFTPYSTIQVAGAAVSTNVVSTTQLTATIPASQLTTLGWLSICVSTAAPGGGLSTSIPLSVYSVVSLAANHMIFDPYTRKIMASVASTSTSVSGNSLVAITPETSTVGTPVFIGSQPSNLGLTDDGQILYVSLLGSNSVARFNMLTQQPDFTISISSPNSYTTYVPADIATLPGSENTIALNLGAYGGLSIYDFNTAAKTATARTSATTYYYSTCPRFLDTSHILTSQSGSLISYPVSSTGLGMPTTSTLYGFNSCIQIARTMAYSGIGGVANVSTTPFSQIGTFSLGTNYSGTQLTAADPSLQRSFFLTNVNQAIFPSANGVAIYDQNTFLPLSTVSLNIPTTESSSTYPILDFFRWGQDGLAALTSGGHIYLLRGAAVVPQLLNTNTAATLTSSSSATITHGAGNTLLTLTGSNFIPGVAVTWNGSYRTTTITDATHVTVAIPASDLSAAGTASLVATNPGAPASSALTLTIN